MLLTNSMLYQKQKTNALSSVLLLRGPEERTSQKSPLPSVFTTGFRKVTSTNGEWEGRTENNAAKI